MAGTKKALCGRLWPRIKQAPSGCWEWQGCLARGYGTIWFQNNHWKVHRIVYQMLVGPLDPILTIDHLCRNPKCCNPKHLEQVSYKTNALRGVGPTAVNAKKTHCIRGHELVGHNLLTRKDRPGNRECRACSEPRWNNRPSRWHTLKAKKEDQ